LTLSGALFRVVHTMINLFRAIPCRGNMFT
jgi:hypothetical protein